MFHLNNVDKNTIGQNLFSPSHQLDYDLKRSAKYRPASQLDLRTRDIISRGLPVLSEKQLREDEAIHPISLVSQEVGQKLENSREQNRAFENKKKALNAVNLKKQDIANPKSKK